MSTKSELLASDERSLNILLRVSYAEINDFSYSVVVELEDLVKMDFQSDNKTDANGRTTTKSDFSYIGVTLLLKLSVCILYEVRTKVYYITYIV